MELMLTTTLAATYRASFLSHLQDDHLALSVTVSPDFHQSTPLFA